MRQLIKRLGVAGLAFFLGAFVAHAQQQPTTVAEVLAQGGKKISASELQQVYSGATIAGTQAGKPNITFKNQYHPNGTVTGASWNNGSSQRPVSGRWSINAAGQACNSLDNGAVNTCVYYFSVAGKYYAAFSDAPTTVVYERQISR